MENTLAQQVLDVNAEVLEERGLSRKPELDELGQPLGELGLGLDSIGRLALLSALEERLGVEFPEERWGQDTFTSLQDIIDFLSNK